MAPCGWTPDFTGCSGGPCCPDSASFDPAIRELVGNVASTILWALTGRQYGQCEVTVRPCKPETCKPLSLSEIIYWDRGNMGNLGVGQFFPTLIDGAVYNIACGCPQGCCTCRADCEVWLPGPVGSIVEVRVGADVVPPTAYMLLDRQKLIFVPGAVGSVPCPGCQDYSQPIGEPGTWAVTYLQGEAVPAVLSLAAGQYACELGRALIGDDGCALPKTIQALSRQGIDMAFADPFALAEQGLVGLPFVDTVIRALNPNRLSQAPQVWSPDLPTVRRQG